MKLICMKYIQLLCNKMYKKIILSFIFSLCLLLTSCSTLGNQLVKLSTDTLGGDYKVSKYSGGNLIKI